MAVRIQVVLDKEERERFRRRAAENGVSLSAWLREAGRQRLAADDSARRMSAAELAAFFAACDEREQGREPSWEQHLEVIERSRARGRSGT